MSERETSKREQFERDVAHASLRGDSGRAALATAIMELADAIREGEGPLAKLFRREGDRR